MIKTNVTTQEAPDKLNEIVGQFSRGEISHVELTEQVLGRLTPNHLRDYFLGSNRLDAILDNFDLAEQHRRMRIYAASLIGDAVGLLAETYEGFVPSVTMTADGMLMVVELDVHSKFHKQDPNTLPVATHVINLSGK